MDETSGLGGVNEEPVRENAVLGEQLNRAWTLRGNQDQVLWRIFGAFWPTNAILLVALFRSGQECTSRPAGLVSSLSGILVAVAWFLIQRRAIGHVKHLESVAERLERKLGLAGDYALTAGLNKRDYDAFLRSGPAARKIMQACTVIIGFFWVLGLTYFIFAAQ